jgi:hypothetical protein
LPFESTASATRRDGLTTAVRWSDITDCPGLEDTPPRSGVRRNAAGKPGCLPMRLLYRPLEGYATNGEKPPAGIFLPSVRSRSASDAAPGPSSRAVRSTAIGQPCPARISPGSGLERHSFEQRARVRSLRNNLSPCGLVSNGGRHGDQAKKEHRCR